MVAVLFLSSFGIYQYTVLNQLAADQSSLTAENQQLLSWGIGATKVANLTRNVVQIDTNRYKITLLSNTLEYRDDFSVAEEVLKYSLTSASSNLDASYRFRENHLSRYQLTSTESAPILTENPPSSILETAKAALERYRAYSGDAYLQEMSNTARNRQPNRWRSYHSGIRQHETPNHPNTAAAPSSSGCTPKKASTSAPKAYA